MDIGRIDRVRGGGRTANPCPIRVSIDSKHEREDAFRIRFLHEVMKAARWQRGDKVRPQIDEKTGQITVSRDPKGWSLTDASGNKSSKNGAATVRVGMTDEARKVLSCFSFPAEITDYVEDGGVVVFYLAKK